MRILTCIVIATSLLMTACTSVVTTYDSTGSKIGSCTAERGFVLGGVASCSGSANQEGRNR